MNENNEEQIPLDIRTPYLNIIRSIQSHARQQCGVAIIELRILVNQNGLPVTWTTPKVTRFEPKGSADQIIDFLKGMM